MRVPLIGILTAVGILAFFYFKMTSILEADRLQPQEITLAASEGARAPEKNAQAETARAMATSKEIQVSGVVSFKLSQTSMGVRVESSDDTTSVAREIRSPTLDSQFQEAEREYEFPYPQGTAPYRFKVKAGNLGSLHDPSGMVVYRMLREGSRVVLQAPDGDTVYSIDTEKMRIYGPGGQLLLTIVAENNGALSALNAGKETVTRVTGALREKRAAAFLVLPVELPFRALLWTHFSQSP